MWNINPSILRWRLRLNLRGLGHLRNIISQRLWRNPEHCDTVYWNGGIEFSMQYSTKPYIPQKTEPTGLGMKDGDSEFNSHIPVGSRSASIRPRSRRLAVPSNRSHSKTLCGWNQLSPSARHSGPASRSETRLSRIRYTSARPGDTSLPTAAAREYPTWWRKSCRPRILATAGGQARALRPPRHPRILDNRPNPGNLAGAHRTHRQQRRRGIYRRNPVPGR